MRKKNISTSLQVGKYQTIGGAIFQMGTVCTEANFSPYGEVGDGDIGKSMIELLKGK